MRIFSNVEQALAETERSLLEMGLNSSDGKHLYIRPWVMSITKPLDYGYAYETVEGGEEIAKTMIKELPDYHDQFREIHHPNTFLELSCLFPGSPTELENKTLISRFLYEVNDKINLNIHSMSLSLLNHLPLTLATSLQFTEAYCVANGKNLGSLYLMLNDLYEDVQVLKERRIF